KLEHMSSAVECDNTQRIKFLCQLFNFFQENWHSEWTECALSSNNDDYGYTKDYQQSHVSMLQDALGLGSIMLLCDDPVKVKNLLVWTYDGSAMCRSVGVMLRLIAYEHVFTLTK
ncbi:MAG TPA: hypothetical protein VJ508_19670, partial [Saprospiraceae bacterium]|nr:hypothetical protein [Saprospiraceae bacterium]